ncbi:BTB/POZ domain-containing protein [Diplonema papillatum]|nr:BTB/POZ domain-containing protein [Diplonema papillatum]
MEPKSFEFSWDAGGVIDWIARGYGTREWRNPHDANDCVVRCSSMREGQPRMFVDRIFKDQVLYTNSEPFSWIQVELPVAVCPTHYRMSHRAGVPKYLLRSWALCASYDGEDWRVLCQHSNDKTLTDESHETLTGAWEVRMPKPEFYPYFRVVIFENGNTDRTNALVASCFELFGKVRHRVWPEDVPITIA